MKYTQQMYTAYTRAQKLIGDYDVDLFFYRGEHGYRLAYVTSTDDFPSHNIDGISVRPFYSTPKGYTEAHKALDDFLSHDRQGKRALNAALYLDRKGNWQFWVWEQWNVNPDPDSRTWEGYRLRFRYVEPNKEAPMPLSIEPSRMSKLFLAFTRAQALLGERNVPLYVIDSSFGVRLAYGWDAEGCIPVELEGIQCELKANCDDWYNGAAKHLQTFLHTEAQRSEARTHTAALYHDNSRSLRIIAWGRLGEKPADTVPPPLCSWEGYPVSFCDVSDVLCRYQDVKEAPECDEITLGVIEDFAKRRKAAGIKYAIPRLSFFLVLGKAGCFAGHVNVNKSECLNVEGGSVWHYPESWFPQSKRATYLNIKNYYQNRDGFKMIVPVVREPLKQDEQLTLHICGTQEFIDTVDPERHLWDPTIVTHVMPPEPEHTQRQDTKGATTMAKLTDKLQAAVKQTSTELQGALWEGGKLHASQAATEHLVKIVKRGLKAANVPFPARYLPAYFARFAEPFFVSAVVLLVVHTHSGFRGASHLETIAIKSATGVAKDFFKSIHERYLQHVINELLSYGRELADNAELAENHDGPSEITANQ